MRRFAALALCFTLSGLCLGDEGATRREVAGLLGRYAGVKTCRCTLDVAFGGRLVGAGQVAKLKVRVALSRPNRLAFRPVAKGLPVLVCDGTSLWQTYPPERTYVESRAPADLDGVILDLRDAGRLSPLLAGLWLRPFSSQGRRAMIAEADEVKWMGSGAVGNASCRQARLTYRSRGMILDLWFAKRDGLIRRLRMDLSAAVAKNYGRPLAHARVTLIEQVEDLAVNKALPADAFRFTPPEGWRRVAELGRAVKLVKGQGLPSGVATLADGSRAALPGKSPQPLVMLFWRSDQPGGELALDAFALVRRRFARRGVRFLAVAVGPGAKSARRLFRQRDYGAALGLDPEGRFAKEMGSGDLPAIVALDPGRRERTRFPASALGVRLRLQRVIEAALKR